MKREFTYPSRDKVTQIHAVEWKPEGEIKAVLQMCHGMVEYIDRYDAYAYRAHPWCTFRFTVNAYYHMFRGIQFAQKKKNIRRIPANLPLFFVAGADDPVGNFGKNVKKVCDTYRKCGIQDVNIKLYENDRHEILNETDRDTVFADILEWLEEKRSRA